MNWIPREVVRAESLSLRQHQELILLDTVRALWRRRWLILAIVALSLALGLLYVQRLESKFTSETIVQLDLDADAPLSVNGPSPTSSLDARSLIESDARIIGSLSKARKVVESLRLETDPEFMPSEGLMSTVRTSIGLPESKRTPDEIAEAVALRVMDNLTVSNDRQSYLISIAYTSTHPEKAALIANKFAEEYLQERRQVSYERASRNRLWLRAQIATAREALASTEQAIIAESATVDVKARQARLSSLESEANSIRERLRSLSDNMQQVGALAELKPASARIAIKAVPMAIPSGPNRVIALGVIGAAAGAFSVLLTLLLERRDTGFRTSAEVARETEKPCLGEIPEMAGFKGHLQEIVLSVAIQEAASAASIHNPTKSRKLILIASALPGEGKSFVSKQLAQSLASSAYRVLLINTSPYSALSTGSMALALEDVLTNSSAREELLTMSGEGQIAEVRRASGLADGQRLFNSSQLCDFLDSVRNDFDYVIVEIPPVLLVTDSWLMGAGADVAVLVAQWNKTPRETVKLALQRLSDRSVHAKGVLLSRVKLKQRRSYHSVDRPYFNRKYQSYYKKTA